VRGCIAMLAEGDGVAAGTVGQRWTSSSLMQLSASPAAGPVDNTHQQLYHAGAYQQQASAMTSYTDRCARPGGISDVATGYSPSGFSGYRSYVPEDSRYNVTSGNGAGAGPQSSTERFRLPAHDLWTDAISVGRTSAVGTLITFIFFIHRNGTQNEENK